MKRLPLALVTCLFWSASAVPANADGISVKPDEWAPGVQLGGRVTIPGKTVRPIWGPRPGAQSGAVAGEQTRMKSKCFFDGAEPDYRCALREFEDAPDAPDAPERELTPGDVLTAVRELGLPRLRIQVQPGTETLVNFDTILHTEPQTFERSVDLLGFDVDLVAEPVSYTWRHGDGTSRTTSRPGRPYPAKDVVHRYERPAKAVHPSVDVTYEVRYRVDGSGWQRLAETIAASGPAATIAVREARPVLTAP